MKTPFDALVRHREHAIDAVRIAIRIEVERLGEIEQRRIALDGHLAQARAIAATDYLLDLQHFVAHARASRQAAVEEEAAVAARLAALRARAGEAYRAISVLRDAAVTFRSDARRRESVIDQAEQDDLTAVRRYRRRRP